MTADVMSAGTTEQGKRISVGIVYGWLYDNITGEKHGGLVCERQEDLSEEDLVTGLLSSLDELYKNGFSEKYSLKDVEINTNTIIPTKKYGTTLVAICFTNFVVPIID